MTASLLKAALVGTAREPLPHAAAELLQLLPQGLSAERRLLLLAGLSAVQRRAAQRPAQHAAAEPAAEETLKPCSARVAQAMLGLLQGGDVRLLAEGAGLLARAGQRLRPELLPLALSLPPGTRELLLPVLGARGPWLAQFREDWRWALGAAPLPPEPAKAWAEGGFEDRLSLLRKLRAADAAAARALVEASWKEEKAEHRAAFLEALKPQLSLADEAFLEAALDDRSAQVRAAAAQLLAGLPGSQLQARMHERAAALVSRGQAAGFLGRLLGGNSLRLQVLAPAELDAAWERDGVPRAPPPGEGARAFWLKRTLALLRPSALEEHLQSSPREIVSALRQTDEALPALQGLTLAALAFDAQGWAAPLWESWIDLKGDDDFAGKALRRLLALMTPSETEARLRPFFAGPGLRLDLAGALPFVPAPWSDAWSMAVIDSLRDTAAAPDIHVVGLAARSVAPAALHRLSLVLERPGEPPLSASHERAVDAAREIVRIRSIFHEEIK